ncbi:MAG TPA: GTP 3',8-cyclase MoaA [Candidatus Limnocylindrales bacterium]|nr:GTP 3',8-cyclase MoaA [Candidatus Limnocylindrales bacterium]
MGATDIGNVSDTTVKPAPDAPRDLFARPLRDLRISVTDRCNFRCPYCMPAEIYGERYEFLPRPEILTFEEIERLARLFVELGVTKIRLTGGEPLLRSQLPHLVRALSSIDGLTDVTLTTNGVLLAEHAAALREAGLRRVTVSLDSLDEEVFSRMSGRRAGPAVVLAAIDAARAAGLSPIKINCVVQRGVNDHTVVDLAAHFRGTGAIVRYIEYMDVGTLNKWDPADVVSAREIVERIGATFPLEPVGANYRGEVARRYRYVDGSGEIGVISSVTQPFCGECSRARLTTDGHFVTCLFASGGVDLKTPMRHGATDDDLRGLMRSVWTNRGDRYSEERATRREGGRKIQMFQIGG